LSNPRKREEIMMQLAMYAMQWERKAATMDQRHAVAEQIRLAQMLLLADEERRSKERPRQKRSILKKLLISPGHAGA
jgi:hypothetical protein